MKVDPSPAAEHDAHIAALREALEEGERSGIVEDYSLEGLLAELDAEPE